MVSDEMMVNPTAVHLGYSTPPPPSERTGPFAGHDAERDPAQHLEQVVRERDEVKAEATRDGPRLGVRRAQLRCLEVHGKVAQFGGLYIHLYSVTWHRVSATHGPCCDAAIQEGVVAANVGGERHVGMPGPVQRDGECESGQDPVVCGAVRSVRTCCRGAGDAHFRMTLTNGMVACEKR
jgi:hypothetical protein